MKMENVSNLVPDTLVRLPQGPTVTGTTALNSSAREVWKVVGNFAGFAQFITGLVWTEMTGSGVRSLRKKIFADGNIVVEQLNSHNDEAMCMTWSLIYTTFNIGNLWASMRVEQSGPMACTVIWDIVGEPWSGGEEAQADFSAFLTSFLDMAMTNLRKMFNK